MRFFFWFVIALLLGGCAASGGPRDKAILLAPAAESAPEVDSLEPHLQELANQIAAGLRERNTARIAVVEYVHLDGSVSELGRFLAEEMITRLHRLGSFSVVERQLLDRVLQEHRLGRSGLVDETTVKQLGKLLGVEAIATGSITDLGDVLRINSRLISTETGTVFSVAATNLPKSAGTLTLSARVAPNAAGGAAQRPAAEPATAARFAPGQVFFEEDFSGYDDLSEVREWGRGLVARKGVDGRMYLTAVSPGAHVAMRDVRFPSDFSLEYDWSYFDGREMGRSAPYVRVPLELIDAKGQVFRIECGNWGGHLPGMSVVDFGEKKMNTFRLVKKGSTYAIYNNGAQIQVGTYEGYGPFTSFRISIPVVRSGAGQHFTGFMGKVITP